MQDLNVYRTVVRCERCHFNCDAWRWVGSYRTCLDCLAVDQHQEATRHNRTASDYADENATLQKNVETLDEVLDKIRDALEECKKFLPEDNAPEGKVSQYQFVLKDLSDKVRQLLEARP